MGKPCIRGMNSGSGDLANPVLGGRPATEQDLIADCLELYVPLEPIAAELVERRFAYCPARALDMSHRYIGLVPSTVGPHTHANTVLCG